MCLRILDGGSRPDPEAAGYGWKVFRKGVGDQVWGPLQGGGPLREGFEASAKSPRVGCDEYPYEEYRAGFHLFESLADAAQFRDGWLCDSRMVYHADLARPVVRRVRWRGLLARGWQESNRRLLDSRLLPCLVAQYVTVLGEGPERERGQ